MPGNAVDWILVELRDATSAANATPATTVAWQAGLLLNNGRIVTTDGTSNLPLDISVTNNLYAVIHHRNHLSVMSANAILPAGGVYTYDFTSSNIQAHGTNSQKELSIGIWGMKSGDTDANGLVGNAEETAVWSNDAGSAGYYPADLNFDQQVNNIDKDDYWVPNMGEGTNVPQ